MLGDVDFAIAWLLLYLLSDPIGFFIFNIAVLIKIPPTVVGFLKKCDLFNVVQQWSS